MKQKWIWSLAALMILGFAGCKKEAQQPAPAPAADAAAPAADAAAPAADAAAPAADAAAPAADAAAPAADAAPAEALFPPMPNVVPAPEDVAAAPADAIKTESGLAYKKLTENAEGKAPALEDFVKVNYTGWTTDGAMFDTSTQGEPAVFIPANLIDGMKEGLLLAKTGEKVRYWIPEDLAYKGTPGAPAGTLVFDFEILDIVTPQMPPAEIPEDAVKLENGIAYRIVRTEPGAQQLKESDFVELDFAGWTQSDGKRFHSSLEVGEPLNAPISAMFPGWKQVLPNAHVGDKVEIWVPQELGISPEGGDLPGTLLFVVDINKALSLPETPADVAAPPADAQKTASGLAYKVLQPGTGTEHPTATSRVRVHYSGWKTDGSMFDSSLVRGEPAEFGLNQVIAGWTEGVQLMVVGEKTRFWIPQDLAYKGQPGAPEGMLVFDVELLDIH